MAMGEMPRRRVQEIFQTDELGQFFQTFPVRRLRQRISGLLRRG